MWRADDDGTRDGERLEQGQVDVTGARRGVEDEVVQVAPVGVAHQLLQGVAGHAATPQGSLFGVDKETDGEQLQPVLLDGDDEVATIDAFGVGTGVFHLEHLGNGGPEDVSVEQAHLVAQLHQGHG